MGKHLSPCVQQYKRRGAAGGEKGTLALQGQTAGWPRPCPGPRGPECLGVSERPSSGLSHGAAGVPTRTCSAERGRDAAGPGAQRRAVGLWGAQRRHRTRSQARARAPLPAGTLQAGSPDPPPSRVPDSSRTTAAPEPCVSARCPPSMAFIRKKRREQQLQLYSKER